MIIKVKKKNDFEIIPRETLQDPRLLMDELGLLVRLASFPTGWEIRPDHIEKTTGWGKERRRRVLDKLQRCGYLRRSRDRRKDGSFIWACELYIESQDVDFKQKFLGEQRKVVGKDHEDLPLPPPSMGEPSMGESTCRKPADIESTEVETEQIIDNNKQQQRDVDVVSNKGPGSDSDLKESHERAQQVDEWAWRIVKARIGLGEVIRNPMRYVKKISGNKQKLSADDLRDLELLEAQSQKNTDTGGSNEDYGRNGNAGCGQDLPSAHRAALEYLDNL